MSFGEKLKKLAEHRHARKLLYVVLFLSVFLTSATGTFLYLNFKKVFVKSNETETSSSLSLPIADPLAPYNVLLLGYGGEGHEGGALADSLIVGHIVPKKKLVTLISVPRDTWVELPIRSDLKENHKINAAYAIGNDDTKYPLKEPQYQGEAGGGEMAKYAVSEVIGMPIEYFISVSFDGFKDTIDILGGIEVNVPVTFDDYFYPVKGLENESCGKSAAEIARLTNTLSGFELEKQFECRYEHIHIDAGKQYMDGDTGLKFVRSRHSEQHGGDFARSERQQAVLFGIKDKVLSLGALNDIVPFINKFADTVRTDMDVAVIKQIIETQGDPGEYKITTINLSEENVFMSTISPDGQFILIPKEGDGVFSGVHTFVRGQIDTQSTSAE